MAVADGGEANGRDGNWQGRGIILSREVLCDERRLDEGSSYSSHMANSNHLFSAFPLFPICPLPHLRAQVGPLVSAGKSASE